MKSFRSFIRIAFILLITCAYFASQTTGTVDALTGDQQQLFESGINFFDSQASGCMTESGSMSSSSTSLGSGSSVYILGDSITEGASSAYTTAFQQKGITANIDASRGRSLITGGSDNNKLTGMQAIANDQSDIKQAGAIIVALGSNGMDTNQTIDQAIAAIRAINPTAPIYWIDTVVVEKSSFDPVIEQANQAIYSQSTSQGYSVISWFKAVDPGGDPLNVSGNIQDPNGYIVQTDGYNLHPTASGASALSNLVVGAVTGSTTNSNTGSSFSCTCGTTTEVIPAGTLPSYIPEPYNGAFTQAGNNHNVSPALVAALFSEEHNLGNSVSNPDLSSLPRQWAQLPQTQPDPNSGWASSSAGAQGPFQFLTSTFTGLGYNVSDINNLAVAADAAAKYAQTDGATVGASDSSIKNFIYSYNHLDAYVQGVMQYYTFYSTGKAPAAGGNSTTLTVASGGCSGNVDCNSPNTNTTGLSQVRQTVVCLAEQQLKNWTPLPPIPRMEYTMYTQGALEEWCADFVSWIYDQAGYPLQPDPNWRVSSVPYIQDIGQNNQNFHWHAVGSGYTPRPGDLAIHGPNHVSMVVSVQGNDMTTIGGDEGNVPQADYGGPNSESYVQQDTYLLSSIGSTDITGFVSPD